MPRMLFQPEPEEILSGYGPTTLTLTAASTAPLGTSTVTITGTSGTLKPPANLIVAPGGTATDSVFVNAEFGFAGAVKLAASGLPAGVTATFSPNPLPSGYATLTLTASSTAALAAKTVTITGISGSLTASTTFQVLVETPTFTLSDSSATLGPGKAGASSVWINWQNASGGNVNLSVSGLPSGVTGTFSPASANTGSTLMLTASSTASLGQYNAVIKGTYGRETSTVLLNITVEPPSFTLWSGGGFSMGRGSSASSWIDLNPGIGFNGTVKLSAVGLPSGVTATFSPNPFTQNSTITITASSTAALGEYNATLVGTSGTQTATLPINVTVFAPTFTLGAQSANLNPASNTQAFVYVRPQYGFTGSVNLSVSGLPSGVTGSFVPNPATDQSTLTLTAGSSAAPGQYNLTITGVCGSQTAKTIMPLTIAGNSFTLWGSGLKVGQGTSASTGVNVTATGTLLHPVQLSVSGLPSGVTASFSPNPTTFSSTLTLTASSTATLGEYVATVTGTSGSQKATVNFTVAVYTPSFTLWSGNWVNIGQGTTITNTVSVYPEYGFSGNVKLTAAGLPSGVTASFSPNPTTNSSTLTLTASGTAPTGLYTVTVTGTSGSQTASTTFTLGVYTPTFTVSVWNGVTMGQGTRATANVSVNSEWGFSGSVKLTASRLPSGVTASFSPNPATGASTLTLTASGTASPGQYTVTVTGTSGSQTASTAFSLGVYVPTFTLNDYYVPVLSAGKSVQSWVDIADEYGFNGSVKLAVSGLPSGVTASFSPNPATGTSSEMTLTAGSAVAGGGSTH